MENNQYILQRCQFDECDATIFIKGPYCTAHTYDRDASIPAATATSSASSPHPGNGHRLQQPLLPKSSPITITPQVRSGDAITVRTPLPVTGSVNEKKQLPKTRKPEPNPPFYDNSTEDSASSSQRPLKRQRLSPDANKDEGGVRRQVSSFPESGSYHSPTMASTNTVGRSHGPVAPPDFSLRPRKEISSLETPPRPISLEDRSISKFLFKNRPRNQQNLCDNSKSNQIPTREIIDLTEDDDRYLQPSSNLIENSNIKIQKRLSDHIEGSDARPRNDVSEPGWKGESIKAPTPRSKDATKSHQDGGTGRREQSSIRKISSNPTPRPLLQKPHVHIAPKPAPALLSPDSQVVSPLENPAIVAHQRSTQSQQENADAAKTTHMPTKEEVDEYIRKIVEKPIALPRSPKIDLGTPLPRLNSEEVSNPSHRSQSQAESDPSSVRVAETRSPEKRHQAAPRPTHFISNRHVARKPVKKPVNESAPAPIIQDQRWRHLNPEERRQVWISKHDPDKFDSYIYGKLNEANRPGSALFGLPEYRQPPRPTRPATHFGHIDPRVHWTRPRSKEWYHQKQNEIRERGTRKSNYGQAAARAARRRREEADDPPRIDIPDRVRNNPTWLSALDELDAMADQYYIQRRTDIQVRREEVQRRKDMESQLMVIDEDNDIIMRDPTEAI
ncbi:hypothetical protein F5Y11DRAFT_297733 [Daldinia sp. FL1419]|nr:hypothetical protein F5Y11DRAFT_297733 [Daldinia sp. FL1419]